jgi:recombination protein RecA
MSTEDQLASTIKSSLNRSGSSGQKTAYFLNDEDNPSNVQEWISTGSTVLDMLISNKEDGGLPVGKIVEFHGSPGSGKSLIASHVLAHTQRKDGIAVYIDTENAVDPQFLRTIGIKPDEGFVLVSEHRVEKVFEHLETIVKKIREKDSDRIVTVVIDSIAGMTTESEDTGDFDKEGFATDKAIVMSRAMRKITRLMGEEKVLLLFTNQIRDNVGTMYGKQYVVPGGKAVPFHASVRVELRKSKSITGTINGRKQPVGATIRPRIRKNRLAPPGKSCEFELYFNSGIDDVGSWWPILKDNNWIQHSSRGWYYVADELDDDGNIVKYYHPDGPTEDKDDAKKFQEATFKDEVIENEEFKEFVFERLKESVLFSYDQDWTRKEVEYVIDDESEPEEQ